MKLEKSPPSTIQLLTQQQLGSLPNGTILVNVFGEIKRSGFDQIDTEERGGLTAWGIPLEKLPGTIPENAQALKKVEPRIASIDKQLP